MVLLLLSRGMGLMSPTRDSFVQRKKIKYIFIYIKKKKSIYPCKRVSPTTERESTKQIREKQEWTAYCDNFVQ